MKISKVSCGMLRVTWQPKAEHAKMAAESESEICGEELLMQRGFEARICGKGIEEQEARGERPEAKRRRQIEGKKRGAERRPLFRLQRRVMLTTGEGDARPRDRGQRRGETGSQVGSTFARAVLKAIDRLHPSYQPISVFKRFKPQAFVIFPCFS